ncbi:metallophosphoesterase family protein [bacterium]|nr:metallophosphoesterase family protein [bacterium]
MKLQIMSDLHLEFGDLEIQPVACDAVILAGDIHTGLRGARWAVETFDGIPVLYITGNHEYYGHKIPKIHTQIEQIALESSLIFLNNQEHAAGGVRFLGATLWSDFCLFGPEERPRVMFESFNAMNDYRRIRMGAEHHYRKLRPEHTLGLHELSVRFLRDKLDQAFDGPTVVITHHLPSPRSLKDGDMNDRVRAAYCSNLEWMIEQYQPDLWIHGHRHKKSDYQIGRTRVICNPRGYAGYKLVEEFDPDLVVEV